MKQSTRGLCVLPLFLSLIGPMILGSGRVAHAASSPPRAVAAALGLCTTARQEHQGTFTLIVASPTITVRGYFVRVVGNGYPVPGESGVLYDGTIPLHGKQEQVVPEGGLNVGVLATRFPHGIPSGTWVTLKGKLRCYAPMGQILFISSWHRWHK